MSLNIHAGWLPLLALACALPAARAQTVTGAEIQEQWVGKEVIGRANNGARIIMTMSADGTAKLLPLGSLQASLSQGLSNLGQSLGDLWTGQRRNPPTPYWDHESAQRPAATRVTDRPPTSFGPN